MINSIFQTLFFKMKIRPNMREQETKFQKINDLLNAETKPKFLCLPYTKQKQNYRKRAFFLEKEEWTIE